LNISHFAKYQLPLLVWLLLIFSISAIPTLPAIKFPLSPDKFAHAGIYFVLCMLGRRAFRHQERWSWLKEHSLLAALLLAVVYGALDEVHQMYVPGRSPDVYDALADSLGASLFVGWAWWSARKGGG
jgi:VanZ family protein